MNKKQTIVILEDDPNRISSFKKKIGDASNLMIFTDVDPCVRYVKNNKDIIDMIFLDHDLGGEIYVDSNDHNTGYTMAKKIKEIYGDNYPQTIVHSMNPSGVKNILEVLKKAEAIPFHLLIRTISV